MIPYLMRSPHYHRLHGSASVEIMKGVGRGQEGPQARVDAGLKVEEG